MRRLSYIILLFLIAGCAPSDRKLAFDETIQGIEFGRGTTVGFLPSGKLRSAFLSRNTTIRGITYKSNTTAKFYDTGVVERGEAAVPADIDGFYFTKWAFVRHNTNGNSRDYYGSAILTVDKTVAGLPLKKGAFVVFGETGYLQRAHLSDDTTVQGLLLKADTLAEFYPSGKLALGCLAKDAVIGGKTVPAGTWIEMIDSDKNEASVYRSDKSMNTNQ